VDLHPSTEDVAFRAETRRWLSLWTLNRRHYPMPDVKLYEPPG
jgi:hypothetical protein